MTVLKSPLLMRRALLTSVSLLAFACACVPAVRADEVIDGGASETVLGDGTGTKPSPWAVTGVLYVGKSTTGTLAIKAGGNVTNVDGYIGSWAGSNGSVTVESAGSTWTNSGNLIVGSSGQGALTIKDGGKVSSAGGYIGYDTGSEGTVTVEGADSTWTNSGDLAVGRSGKGALTIKNGGTVSNTGSYIGYDPGTEGTVTVEGTGSTWTNSGTLYVGSWGNGALSIKDGGKVSIIGTLTIAQVSGVTGTINIGADALSAAAAAGQLDATGITFGPGTGKLVFNHTSTLTFATKISGTSPNSTIQHLAGTTILTGKSSGFTGKANISGGALLIKDGGTLGNSVGAIGDTVGSDGSVTVEGVGSTWANSSVLRVADSGKGALTIKDGGKVTNTIGNVGYNSGSVGVATVEGAGSLWKSTSSLYVGGSNINSTGKGALTIRSGGAVESAGGYIAYNTGSEGTVTIDGVGSTWTNSSILRVADMGKGALTIKDGGTVTNATGYVGFSGGSVGVVTVEGAGSRWTNSSSLYVGDAGKGTLTIKDGGTVTNSNFGFIADASGAEGTVTVEGIGSKWTLGIFYIASLGKGALNIKGKGQVSNTDGSIGDISGSEGTVTVEGAGSKWTNSGSLNVGFRGKGALSIKDGATVSSVVSNIGNALGSEGTVTVEGAGSKWTSSSNLTLGQQGKGALSIKDGATVSSVASNIGNSSGSEGTVTVEGTGSKWTSSSNLTLGQQGKAALSIKNAGSVTNTNGFIGNNSVNSEGTVTVQGDGSSWVNAGNLTVGGKGKGALTIKDGGKVSVTGITTIASVAGSIGALNIGADALSAAASAGQLDAPSIAFGAGAGTLVFNHTGTTTFAAVMSGGAGTGTINHKAGITKLTGDSTSFAGVTTVAGGTLLVGDASGNGKLGGQVNVASGATLGGSGTITGNVDVSGKLAAGNSPGTLTITGNLNLNATAATVFELNAPGVIGSASNDLIKVNGNLTRGGTLQALVGLGGYYRLFNYTGTLGGSFAATTVNGTGGFVVGKYEVQAGIPNQINLVALGAGQIMQFWDGADVLGNGVVDGGTGTWNAASTNWTGQPGEANINGSWLGAGVVGVFQGAAGTVTVVGDQAFDTLQFNTDGYLLTGGGLAITPAAGAVGSVNVGGGMTATIEAVFKDGAGTSALRKVGNGTLELSGANTYTGGTIVEAGVLRVLAGGTLGDSNNNVTVEGGELQIGAGVSVTSKHAVLGANAGGNGSAMVSGANAKWQSDTIIVGNKGAGTLTLTQGGVVITGAITLAAQAGATGTLALGAAEGATAGSIGQINTTGIVFGSGAGKLVFNHTDTGYVFSSTLSGAGAIIHAAGRTTFTGDSASFSGLTTLSGGALTVDGKLGGSVNVGAGGALTGSGMVNAATVSGQLAGTVGSTFIIDTLHLTSTAAVSVTVPVGASSSSAAAFRGMTAVLGGTITDVALPVGFSVGDANASFYVFGYTNRTGEIIVADSVKAAYAGSDFTFGGVEYGYLVLNSKSKKPDPAVQTVDYKNIPNQHIWSGVTSTFVDGSTWRNGVAVFNNDATNRPAVLVEGRVLLGGLVINGANYSFNDAGNAQAPAVFSLVADGASNTTNLSVAMGGSAAINIPLGGADFHKTGEGTLTLAGKSNDYKGTVTVKGGMLSIANDFSHARFVADKGLLRVNGQADVVTVNASGALDGLASGLPAGKVNIKSLIVNGGTLKPGNSPGTIRLGSYVQNGGTVEFEKGDLIEVVAGAGGAQDGRAIFAYGSNSAPVQLSLIDSRDYRLGNNYTFVTAQNGVSFTLPDAVRVSEMGSSRLFSQFKAEAVGNEGRFYLERSRGFASTAWSPNQFSVARALDVDAIGSRNSVNPLYDAIANATNDLAFGVRLAFDQLSGQIYPATQDVLIDESRHLRDALNTRTRAALDNEAVTGQAERKLNGSGSDIGLWGQGYGSWGIAGRIPQSSKLDLSTAGFVLGADGASVGGWRFGFAGGYGTSEIENKALLSKSNVDNYQMAVYGGNRFGALGLQFGLGHTWHNIDTSRQLNVASLGLRDLQHANYDARTLQLYAGADYAIKMRLMTLEPFANLAYVAHQADGVAEQDTGLGAALSGRTSNSGTGFSTVGMHVSHKIDLMGFHGTVQGRLGWRHAFGDTNPDASFIMAKSSAFSVTGTSIAKDAMVMDFGGDVAIADNTRLGLVYSGQVSKNASDNGLKGNLSIRF